MWFPCGFGRSEMLRRNLIRLLDSDRTCWIATVNDGGAVSVAPLRRPACAIEPSSTAWLDSGKVALSWLRHGDS
jgi:hypothetical protein